MTTDATNPTNEPAQPHDAAAASACPTKLMASAAQSTDRRGERVFRVLAMLGWLWINLWAAYYYEPWRDVAQGWLIARDASLSELFGALRYEGHPCLWYLLLVPFAKLGLPYQTVIGISMAFTGAAAYLFLRVSPWSKPERLLMLFSALLIYELPVIARVYSVIPLLILLVWIAYPTRHEHPLRYALALGVLAQTHILMIGFVGLLMLYWFIESVGGLRRRTLRPLPTLAALAVMLAAIGFLAWQLAGSIDANATVSVRRFASLKETAQRAAEAISEWTNWLTRVPVYEHGNTGYLLTAIPFALGFAALAALWLVRAPKSAILAIVSLGWHFAVYTFIYVQSLQRVVIGAWLLVFCVMLAIRDAKPAPVDRLLTRFLSTVLVACCAASYARIYPELADNSQYMTSASRWAASYINSLPEDDVVLLENEPMASSVAAWCKPGRFYNPIRDNGHCYTLVDDRFEGWCRTADLDATMARLRERGETSVLLLIHEPAAAQAETMAARSSHSLVLEQRFHSDNTDESYILYRVE